MISTRLVELADVKRLRDKLNMAYRYNAIFFKKYNTLIAIKINLFFLVHLDENYYGYNQS